MDSGMTDAERLDALQAFVPDHVWILNRVRNKEVLSVFAMPVRPVVRAYAERFNVPFWGSLREAIDAFVENSPRPPAAKGQK